MNGEPLIRVEPDKNLVFRLVERRRASSTFRIWNNTESYVAFKVKTTDPPRFRGGPSYGILLPRSYHDVEVTVLGEEESQHVDWVLIKSLEVASGNYTENSIRRMFRERQAAVENYVLRVVYARQPWDLFRRAIFFAFSCLVFWFLTMAILSRIWTLIYGVTVLVLRMMRVRALDAAEEWVGRTLLWLGLCFVSAAREHVLDLCFRWLRVIYEAFRAQCDYLFSFLFEPEERRPLY